jgi:hypothetical protein
MRTTLDIDEDVLIAAKELARRNGKTAGMIISELSRRALSGTPASQGSGQPRAAGFRPFQSRGGMVTNAQINRLREEEDV